MAQLLWMVPLALVLAILLIRKFKAARRNYTRKIIKCRLEAMRAENERFRQAREQKS
ncbi:MAG: hypothetical protein SRB2_04471 [Desulfobacteraceae bacterium Eth-SRB2]|nr:MAG: hypothetical protein SRB2_04471 [Desulfobacteraceae bacterium Eth-SRB2]